MVRLRLLIWLLAIVALAMPIAGFPGGPAANARTMAVDCADHPAPDPCPDHGSARHAAGLCCPMMTGSVAVFAVVPRLAAASLPVIPPPIAGALRAGRLFTQDPPPPRT